MVMLPIALSANFDVGIGFVGVFIANISIHASVDDMKANKRIINLWTDQLIHIAQICATFLLFR
jgi:hypothetical protein